MKRIVLVVLFVLVPSSSFSAQVTLTNSMNLGTYRGNENSMFTELYGRTHYTLLSEMTTDATHRLVTDTLISTWNAKQDPLSNASTLAKITESGGVPLWNGSAWPGGSGEGYTNLMSFVDQTPWRLFYSDGSGDVKELALGADGTYLKFNGATSAPTAAVPSGSGDMVLATAQSVTGAKTFDSSMLIIKGSGTGTNTIANATADSTSYTNTLPAKTGTFAMTSDNITGTAAGLTSQYIDWSASSGGNSIANKPTLPSGEILGTTDAQSISGKLYLTPWVDAHASGAIAAGALQQANVSNCSLGGTCQNGATTDVAMTYTPTSYDKFNMINSATLSGGHTYKITFASGLINLNGTQSSASALIFTNAAIGDEVSCISYPIAGPGTNYYCTSTASTVTAP
jgi:hypothetical protein